MDEKLQVRSIYVPPHRIRRIKQEWMKIYTAVVEIGKLQIRYNLKSKSVDLRTCEHTVDSAYLDRSTAFITAIIEGFKLDDAMAIMRYRDIFIDKFDISEVRKMKSSHLQRAMGRIIGRQGRTKESIENFSKCKFILIDQKIALLGCVENIKIAKDAIGRLIQGSEPTSVCNRLRVISTKLKDKYGCLQTIYEDLKEQ
ncbi:hypothetical protein NUSPORA_02924 [Nucleospora cyclopteri]